MPQVCCPKANLKAIMGTRGRNISRLSFTAGRERIKQEGGSRAKSVLQKLIL